jgi:transcriptional regulator
MDDENRPVTPPPPYQRYKSPPWPDRTHLTRDQRLQVKTLHLTGYSQRGISKKLEINRKKVRTTIEKPATP